MRQFYEEFLMKHEYGIAVLKPDGNKPEIYDCLMTLLKKNDMTIIETSSLRLTEKVLREKFAPNAVPFEEYTQYMTSGDIQAILVHGEKVGMKLMDLKKEFREMHGFKKDTTANMLHTSDQGVEYYLQFPIFFPHLDVRKYCATTDMHVRIDSCKLSELKRIEAETNLSNIGVILESGQSCDVIKKYREEGGRLTTFYGVTKAFHDEDNSLNIIGYLPKKHEEISESNFIHTHTTIEAYVNYIQSLGGYVVLDYLPFEKFNEVLYEKLKSWGIQGVMTYDPRRTLYEVEVLEDIIIDLGLENTGGTNGHASIGELTLGQDDFENIFKHFAS